MTEPDGPTTVRRYRRSPFLALQWDGADLVVVDCETMRRFRADERLVALLRQLGDWTAAGELGDVGEDDLEPLVDMGIVQADGPDTAETAVPSYWSCFDLAVQRLQSTGGRQGQVTTTKDPPPSAFKPRPAGPLVELPHAPALRGGLATVLERRRTARTYADRSLRLEELSGVLHHSVRVQATSWDEVLGERTRRPFPSGGARSELEIHVVANDVTGLVAGVHYYDARAHCLVRIGDRDQHQNQLNRWLHGAAGSALNRDPPAVFLITAVFARVMWKYGAIGLPLIYRNVGCLYQTLYLVAVALDLAPCAIGAGEEAANARWLGLDPLEESQVGCFLLGAAA